MLEFIRRIFQGEEIESKKTIEISLQESEQWLNEKSKPLMEEVMQNAGSVLMKIGEEVERARLNIEALENAKLQNPNIPFKAKQYMEGNRKAYIKAINSFIGCIAISNRDYFYLLDFCGEFNGLINELNRGTLRSYTILQEFLANETGNIALNLKNIDMLFKELKSALTDEKAVTANKLKEKMKSLKSKAMQRINLDIEIKKTEAELNLAEGEKTSLMSEIRAFNDSEEHRNFLKLKEEKESKAGAFYDDESIILESFSVLEKPLRKYSHMEFGHEEIVLNYIGQPVESLLNDKSLEILKILENLQDFLTKGKLQVDDKKKEKSIEEIKKLNKEFLQQFIKKHGSFRAETEEIDGKIILSGVPEKLRKFHSELKDIDLSIKKNENDLKQLKNEISKSANILSSLKNEIESDIKKIFRHDVAIHL